MRGNFPASALRSLPSSPRISLAPEVTPHPSRAGWLKRRPRSTLSPAERAGYHRSSPSLKAISLEVKPEDVPDAGAKTCE
jgi:hypothetical protein